MKVGILYKTSTRFFSTTYQIVFAIPLNIIVPYKYIEFLNYSISPDFSGEVDFECQYIIPNTTNPLELLKIYGELCSINEDRGFYDTAYITYISKPVPPCCCHNYWIEYDKVVEEGYIDVMLPKNKEWSRIIVVDRSKEDLIAGLDITKFDVIDKYGGVKFKFSDLPNLAKEFEEDLGENHKCKS